MIFRLIFIGLWLSPLILQCHCSSLGYGKQIIKLYCFCLSCFLQCWPDLKCPRPDSHFHAMTRTSKSKCNKDTEGAKIRHYCKTQERDYMVHSHVWKVYYFCAWNSSLFPHMNFLIYFIGYAITVVPFFLPFIPLHPSTPSH